MNRLKFTATWTRFLARCIKPLAVPGTLLLINLALLANQVVLVLLGMPDWSALLTQLRDTVQCAQDFLTAVAALPKKQTGDTPRIDRNVPPSC